MQDTCAKAPRQDHAWHTSASNAAGAAGVEGPRTRHRRIWGWGFWDSGGAGGAGLPAGHWGALGGTGLPAGCWGALGGDRAASRALGLPGPTLPWTHSAGVRETLWAPPSPQRGVLPVDGCPLILTPVFGWRSHGDTCPWVTRSAQRPGPWGAPIQDTLPHTWPCTPWHPGAVRNSVRPSSLTHGL